jgi:PAS domain S-box-containing protein
MNQIPDFSEKFTVLIIEDNQGDFVLVEDYLFEKFKQINIVHCLTYQTSINYLKNSKEKPALILLDLHLPDLWGLELINGILTHCFKIPIIILCGYSDLAMARSSIQTGIYDYLIKDEINPDILYRTIIFAFNRGSFINQIESGKLNYENLFNFNPQPTWLLDDESFKILHANIAAQKRYGHSLDDFLNMSFMQLHPKEEEQLIVNKFTSKEEHFSANQFSHFLSDGKEIKVEIYFKEIKSNSNSGVIVQSNDISEVLKYIQTIEIQNEKLRSIAWTQSHEVRAPLSRILGIINMIELQPDDRDEVLFWLKQLRVSSNELDDMIKKTVHETRQIKQQ